jgi:hypothetical protein
MNHCFPVLNDQHLSAEVISAGTDATEVADKTRSMQVGVAWADLV